MKRDYIKPAMRVYKLQQKCHILVGSDTVNTINVEELNNGEELEYLGGGDGLGR